MKQIHIFGPFNTGTNLIMNILTDNLLYGDHGEKVSVDKSNTCIWKHTLDTDLIKCYLENQNNIMIIMYKSVYNWIESCDRKMYRTKKVDGSIFKKICMTHYNLGYDLSKIREGIEGSKKQKINGKSERSCDELNFSNGLELYNKYYSSYIDLIENNNDNNNIIWLDYHKICDKKSIFSYLEKKFSPLLLKIDSEEKVLKQLSIPSKTSMSVKNSDQALDKYDKVQSKTKKLLIDVGLIDSVREDIIKYFEG